MEVGDNVIKQSIKNYFINLKHFFTPLGTFFLGVVVGLSILIPGSISLVNDLGEDVTILINKTSLDFNALLDSTINSISHLSWSNDFGEALRTLFNPKFISEVLDNGLHALVGDYGAYANDIALMIEKTINGFLPLFVGLIFFSLLGLLGGFYLTKYLVRKEVAERGFTKFILVSILDSILSALVIAFMIWLTAIWKYSGIFVLLVGITIFGFTSLYEAYFVHHTKNMKIRDIVNLRNSGRLAISNALIFLISILSISLVSTLINPIVGVFVGVSFVEIGFVVINLNAEAYVKAEALKA